MSDFIKYQDLLIHSHPIPIPPLPLLFLFYINRVVPKMPPSIHCILTSLIPFKFAHEDHWSIGWPFRQSAKKIHTEHTATATVEAQEDGGKEQACEHRV